MKKFNFATKKIMTPGPVPLSDQVKQVLGHYECHHRTAEFTEVLVQVFADLKKIFQTKEHCFLLASTGTGALEASLVNTIKSTDQVLSISTGKFGERWGKISKAYKLSNTELSFPWGKKIDLDRLRAELKTKKYNVLAFQACETSTGSLLPVKEITELCQEFNVLSVVDGITALGAVNLPMDEWGIDVLIGGSQKAFMLPTGLSFISFSEKAQAVQSDLSTFYFDLKAERKANLQNKTRFSTPTHFVLALHLVLDEILNKVGFAKHLKNIEDKAFYFRDQVGLEMFPEVPAPSLTCLKVPENKSANQIKAKVAEDGYIIMGGQEQLADKVLRVGHMGDISKEDLRLTAEAIKRHL